MRSPIIWGNLLAMLAVAVGLLFALRKGLDIYTGHGKEIEIPNVTGKMPADAIYTLEMQGLRGEVEDSTYDRSLPPGVIMQQKPAAGSSVKEGRLVRLTINSRNAPTISLPDIAGNSSVREAQDRLRQLGFRLGPIEYVKGEKDWVYGIKHGGRLVYSGERVPTEATLVLQVGGGDVSDSMSYDEFLPELDTETETYDYE